MADENNNGVEDSQEGSARVSGPPAGGAAPQSRGFIGGFPDDYTPSPRPLEGRESMLRGPGWRPGDRPGVAPAAPSLAALREAGAGGYVVGDEWRPVNWGSTRIFDLQQQLARAGLYPGDADVQPGYFDEATRQAYRDLLERANAMGLPWEMARDELIANPLPPEAPPKRAPLVARVTNPADITAAARAGVRKALGFVPDDIDFDALVAKRQSEEIGFQQAAYNAEATGGTITAPMDIETFVDTQAKMADPTAYDSRKVVDAADFVVRMMRGEV